MRGLGLDLLEIERLERALARRPGLRERLFTDAERDLPLMSLAARFAAKEALAKALGAPVGLRWTDVTVVREGNGRPHLRVVGTVAARADELGVTALHVSLSHDAGVASAVVVAEGA
jgi:holo-[acyl-carrier protein] synthase